MIYIVAGAAVIVFAVLFGLLLVSLVRYATEGSAILRAQQAELTRMRKWREAHR